MRPFLLYTCSPHVKRRGLNTCRDDVTCRFLATILRPRKLGFWRPRHWSFYLHIQRSNQRMYDFFAPFVVFTLWFYVYNLYTLIIQDLKNAWSKSCLLWWVTSPNVSFCLTVHLGDKSPHLIHMRLKSIHRDLVLNHSRWEQSDITPVINCRGYPDRWPRHLCRCLCPSIKFFQPPPVPDGPNGHRAWAVRPAVRSLLPLKVQRKTVV